MLQEPAAAVAQAACQEAANQGIGKRGRASRQLAAPFERLVEEAQGAAGPLDADPLLGMGRKLAVCDGYLAACGFQGVPPGHMIPKRRYKGPGISRAQSTKQSRDIGSSPQQGDVTVLLLL